MTLSATLLGVDFTSAPSRRKPITVARGHVAGGVLRLDGVQACPRWVDFEAVLAAPGPWLGAFDFPFGLPRGFVDALGLGDDRRGRARGAARALPRPHGLPGPGRRLGPDAAGRPAPAAPRHRPRAGRASRPTSPLQTRYVPVGFMYFEGLARLLAAGLHLPGLHDGDRTRTRGRGLPGRAGAGADRAALVQEHARPTTG